MKAHPTSQSITEFALVTTVTVLGAWLAAYLSEYIYTIFLKTLVIPFGDPILVLGAMILSIAGIAAIVISLSYRKNIDSSI